ncbi:MAG: hypothetical protein NWR39_02880, partial [Pseudomonadota bacterium]|nr:hypothetical protein [Pseudomonadota bacterium]
IRFHPLAKKIAILVIVKVTILWFFFKIIPVKKIRLNVEIVENHFLNDSKQNTQKEKASYDQR